VSFITTQFGLFLRGAKVTITRFAVPGVITVVWNTCGVPVAIVNEPEPGKATRPVVLFGAAPTNVSVADPGATTTVCPAFGV
jgi:hypothetical protein